MRRLLARRELRFLLVGGWNTVFGIAAFAGLTWLTRAWGLHYFVVYAAATVLAVTNAYACYKVFVFRTTGAILPEYLRFWRSYAVTMAVQFGAFALLVSGLHAPPIPSQAAVVVVSVAVGWLAHSRYSFGPRPRGENE